MNAQSKFQDGKPPDQLRKNLMIPQSKLEKAAPHYGKLSSDT
jgi:hypothetical protein